MSVDWANLLKGNTNWFCQDCDTSFVCDYPPLCPTCGQFNVDLSWLNQRQAEEDDLEWERRREYQRAKELRRGMQQAYETWLQGYIGEVNDMLTKHGIPLPEDQHAYRLVHYLHGRPAALRRYFRRYSYWEPRVGPKVAHKQVLYEVRQAVVRARNTGLTYQELAECCDMTRERARQHVERHRRWMLYPRHRETYKRETSPVEEYLRERDWLAGFIKHRPSRVTKLPAGDPYEYWGA